MVTTPPGKAVKKPLPKPATRTAAKPAVKPPVKPPVKAVAKPAAKDVAKPAAKPEKAASTDRPKKIKLVRDSFTIPKAEFVVLDALKARAAKLARPAKKSELLRAGIKALAALSDAAFLAALQAVPTIKTGRPKA